MNDLAPPAHVRNQERGGEALFSRSQVAVVLIDLRGPRKELLRRAVAGLSLDGDPAEGGLEAWHSERCPAFPCPGKRIIQGRGSLSAHPPTRGIMLLHK
jgi:hypothetical protein